MTLKRVSVLLVALCFMTGMMLASEFPAGTKVTVRVNKELSSASALAGQTWDGVLSNDIVVGGKTIAKSGSNVAGKIVSAKSSGRLKTPGALSIRLTSIAGKPVTTASRSFQGKSHTKSNATKIGGGTAAGALIGGLAGGGKGAAIGALAGAGAGTGAAAYTGKMEAVVPAESAVTFTVTAGAARKK